LSATAEPKRRYGRMPHDAFEQYAAAPAGTPLSDMARLWGVAPTAVHKAAKRQKWAERLPKTKRPRHGGNRAVKPDAPIGMVEWARNSTPADGDVARLLKAENSLLRRKISSTGANAQLVLDAVRQAFEDYIPPTLPEPMPSKGRETEVAVAHVSDTQIGKITATYDTEIACGRLWEYAVKVGKCIMRHRSYARVEEIHLYLGGDMVEGELIFPGQAHSIDQPVFSQSMKAGPNAVAKMVLYWLKFVKRVRIVCVAGNHGRPASKHAGSHHLSNWDRVFYETVRLILIGPEGREHKDTSGRVTFDAPDTFYAINDVLGHKHLIVHGDQIRGGHAGIPWYGTSRKAQGWIDSIPGDWTSLYFGHFHTLVSATLNLRKWYCNGTLESDNEYAQEQLAACGRPVQRLQFWNEEHGMVADRPIYLTYGL
jgi:hypothetical protein